MVTTDFISTESREKACRQLTVALGAEQPCYFPMPMFCRPGTDFVVKRVHSEPDSIWPDRAGAFWAVSVADGR